MDQQVMIITVDTQTVFKTRTKGLWSEWADFHINAGQGWVTVTVRCSFGSFAHHWSAIGQRPWYDFLNEIDMDYTMTKMLDGKTDEWDEQGSYNAVMQIIDEYGTDDREELLEFLDNVNKECGPDVFYNDLMDNSFFFDFEYGDMIINRMKPWIRNFWLILWEPCMKQIAETEDLRNAITYTE